MYMKKYIGDKNFYKHTLLIAIPIMIQNGITNFVNLLDNIMVGQLGTDAMSGVAISNQFIFVFNICIFGGISGAGIFSAQFFGNKNHKGVRNAFRFKLVICALITLLCISIFGFFNEELISLFLHEGSNTGNISNTLNFGRNYLLISLIGLCPFAITQCYSGTLRETGETIIPMKAGISAVLINLIFNYILIFGKLGFPAFGVYGAAISTVISRFVECSIVVSWTHIHKKKNVFIQNVYKNFSIPKNLVKHIILKGFPLMFNECLWAIGMAFIAQCYSLGGLSVVAAYNISSTISNLFNVVFIALGSSISIIVGQLLGAEKMKEAKETDTKLIAFSVSTCFVVGSMMFVLAPLFPSIYNTTDEVKTLANNFIRILALCMPLMAFTHASYFTLRSGGKTLITFLFDSIFVWIVSLPAAYVLMRFTSLNVIVVYAICQSLEFIKCIIGFILVKKDVWINNIVV